jgi:Protein of unknown function (DUF2752)
LAVLVRVPVARRHPLNSGPLSPIAQRQRQLYLLLVALPLAIALLNRWGVHLTLWGCPLVKWIGVPCPGWGLTRSFYATMRGDFGAAMNFHLFGPLLVLMATIATGHLGLELFKGRRIQTFYTPWISRQRFWLAGFGVIFGYHMTRLVALESGGQIAQWFGQSIVGRGGFGF